MFVYLRDNRLGVHVVYPVMCPPEHLWSTSCLLAAYKLLCSHVLFSLEGQSSWRSGPRGEAVGLQMCADVQLKDCFMLSMLPKDFIPHREG